MKLRYVFSAPAMLRIQPCSMSNDFPEQYAIFSGMVNDCVSKVKKDVFSKISGIDFEIDVLFNAYTEKEHGIHIRRNNNFSFEKLYADSGGLQIVTLGKPIDDALKKDIYKSQSCADFAMCFDEIPTRSIITSNGSSSSRSRVTDKMYFQEESERCAIKTANNIKEQCDVLSEINDTTKVMYIVQGNNENDMYEWFKYGTDVLKSYDRIGGLALADTCIGNGVLESVEMFIAYNRIRAEFGEGMTNNHIHLLGVGSVGRVMPMLWVKDSLLPDDITVSFDSTSFSLTYIMGKFTDASGKSVKRNKLAKYIMEVLAYFEPVIKKYEPDFDKEKYAKYYFNNIMSVADTLNNVPLDQKHIPMSHIVSTIVYQLFGFMEILNRAIAEMKQSNSPLSLLKHVHGYDDYKSWKATYAKYIDSARIQRAPGVVLEM